MIGYLKGQIIYRQPPHLMIDVNGVGYEIEAPMSTFYAIPDGDKTVTLFTHLVVREDMQALYGFHSFQDRAIFRQLIKVSGIGAKMALAILSGMNIDEFIQCIQNRDALTLVRIPGVGKKTAERLIIEMIDKITGISISHSDMAISTEQTAQTAQNTEANTQHDAISALIALGYKQQDAHKMIKGISEKSLSVEDTIRLALKKTIKK